MKVCIRALHEPVALSAAVIGLLNVIVAFGVLHLTNEQLSVLNLTLASVLGFLTRMVVTPVVRPRGHGRRSLVPSHDASGV